MDPTASSLSEVEATRSPAIRKVGNLRGPAGQLEALLNEGRDDAVLAALVCHPHPLFGGTMHNKVVYHAMKALASFGLPVLRFNFRGAGLSAGEHDNGHGERDDVRAALDWLDREYRLPMLFAGFSFGASVGLRTCCDDLRVKGLIALGAPVHAEGRDYHYTFLSRCRTPKLFVSGTRDHYGPIAQLEQVVESAAPPAELVWIADADHFFTGHLEAMQAAVRSWVAAQFLAI